MSQEPAVGQIITFDQLRRCESKCQSVGFEWNGVAFTFVPTNGYGNNEPPRPLMIGRYKFGQHKPPATWVQVAVPIGLDDSYENRLEMLRLIENIAGHVGVHVQCERAFRKTHGLSADEGES